MLTHSKAKIANELKGKYFKKSLEQFVRILREQTIVTPIQLRFDKIDKSKADRKGILQYS